MPNIHSVFDAFQTKNILILGDVMIDRYLSGKVERISPEAPVPVVHLQNAEDRLGGAANVALNIKAMGAKAHLLSIVGTDDNGTKFIDLLPTYGLSSMGIIRSNSRPTTVKTRVLASNQQLLRVDQESTEDLSTAETTTLLQRLRDLLDSQKIDLILFQDYNKGVLSLRIIREVMLEALRRDIPTAVDPKKRNFLAYRKAHLFKPNLKEVQEGLPFEVKPQAKSLHRAAEYLCQELSCSSVLITLSERGIFLYDDQQSTILPTLPRTIADVCGAGDTVISIAALGLAAGMSLKDIALLANLAGGQVCEKVGVVPVNRDQLQKEYEKLLFEIQEPDF